MGLRRGNSGNLAEAGWGVIFAQGDPQESELREALKPLLDLRKSQAGRVSARYYREFRGGEGYQPEETKEAFLERFGIGPGPADPNYVPYYLLIVGSPETIPFSFQYDLDIQYGVGRICFDTVEEYENYACAVVAAETSPPQRPRAAAFFAPRHPGDFCTELSSGWLAKPLAAHVESHCPDWEVHSLLGPDASKQNLQRFLGGDETPSFLFTASHGMVYPVTMAEYQHDLQGSLLCNDWPGPQGPRGSMSEDRYFCSRDLNDKAHLAGLICFHYACHSAGTPAIKDFLPHSREPVQAAPKPFVSSLAQRLLGYPGGGALAVIGHVESTWTSSIQWGEINEPQIQVFEDAITSLLGGGPVGAAMEVFGERYAELAASLSREFQLIRTGQKKENSDYLATVWTACNDARNCIVLGDPAVRLTQRKGDPDEQDQQASRTQTAERASRPPRRQAAAELRRDSRSPRGQTASELRRNVRRNPRGVPETAGEKVGIEHEQVMGGRSARPLPFGVDGTTGGFAFKPGGGLLPQWLKNRREKK